MNARLILAEKDYLTVKEAAAYAGVSYSHWRRSVQPQFPPGEFKGVNIYRRSDVDLRFGFAVDDRRTRRLERDRKIERYRQYRINNASKFAARTAARRARKILCTPIWADHAAVAAVYAACRRTSAETGIQHHVDHIVPLKGRDVCGLHVHYNLQILTWIENISKGNR